MTNLKILEQAAGGGNSMLLMLAVYAVFIVALYFIFFRPQNKKKKKEAAMRKNAQVGDDIVTIGGITGRIVAVKEEADAIIIETGTDRTKILVKKWAIGTVVTVHEDDEQ